MNLTKKIVQFLTLIFFALPLFSCKEGCVEADEFDSQSIMIDSRPEDDEIFGNYDPINGGQRINWNEHGLRNNGKAMLMQIAGSWTSLQGKNDSHLASLPRCKICTRKPGVDNCICHKDQKSEAELDSAGKAYTKDADGTKLNCATDPSHQDDAVRCTCTKQHGNATDYGAYHIPLDLLDKYGVVDLPDQQTNCKYDRGMGAYMALWGSRGVTTPTRAYHIFSEESVCNVTLDGNGKCVNEDGNDITRYVFRSANNRVFMEDDQDGNDDIDSDTGNDIYHPANEVLKSIMLDQYYSDNYGSYNVQIFGGVGSESEISLLESIVSLIEDMLLGETNNDGERDGGIIKSLYMAVVNDTGFAQVVQVSLTLYITLFGAAHLWGLVEMNKKELISRVLKIGLIMFFISPTSWIFYNDFIVTFFKDGMDYLVGMMMTLADSNIEQTSMIKVAQMDRAADASNATRFAYVDLIIRNLMSEAAAKKIIALFFDSFFGWLYILAIYFLIFLFIAVMLYIATIYIVNLMKLIFVLSIGPVFIVFTLFTKTAGYFRNWLGYLGGRSFEILMLFIVVYLFVTIIDKNFTEMLLYKACGESWGLGPLRIIILKANIDRSLLQWLLYFVTIAALIWIMYEVVNKMPNVVAALFSLKIGGAAAGHGIESFSSEEYSKRSYAANLAGAIAHNIAGSTARVGGFIGSNVLAPIAKAGLSKMGALRKSIIDNRIAAARRNHIMGKELKLAIAANPHNKADAEAAFMKAMEEKMETQSEKMAALKINEKSIRAFLNQKLVKEPMQNFLKQAIEEMKQLPPDKIPIGNEAVVKHLTDKLFEWAQKEGYSTKSQAKMRSLLNDKDIKDLMISAVTLPEAADFVESSTGKKKECQTIPETAEERRDKKLKSYIQDKKTYKEVEEILTKLADTETKKEVTAIADKAQKDVAAASAEDEKIGILNEAKKAIESIIPTGLSLDDFLGEGASAALLKESNLLPTASSPLPGGDQQDKKQASETEINSMKMGSNLLHGQIKVANMDLQLAEIELEKLRISGDQQQIAEIDKKIADIRKEIITLESQYKAVEDKIQESSNTSSR